MMRATTEEADNYYSCGGNIPNTICVVYEGGKSSSDPGDSDIGF